MDRRKELANEYKKRKLRGGIYTITNTRTGSYFLSHAVDIQAARNRFDFMLSTGAGFPINLQKEWSESGRESFAFKILEELEMKPTQTRDDFKDDLETREASWQKKLKII